MTPSLYLSLAAVRELLVLVEDTEQRLVDILGDLDDNVRLGLTDFNGIGVQEQVVVRLCAISGGLDEADEWALYIVQPVVVTVGLCTISEESTYTCIYLIHNELLLRPIRTILQPAISGGVQHERCSVLSSEVMSMRVLS